MRLGVALIASAALALAACGGDDEPDPAATTGPTSPTTGTETAPPAADPGAGAVLNASDEAGIHEVVVAAATNREPCEHLTDRYLEEFVLDGVTSDDPAAACRQAEQGQTELRESDVRIIAVRGGRDEAEVLFSIAGIEQVAMVVREGGRWLIDKFDV